MNKIIIGIAVAIIVVWSILNVGGNTSTTEGVLNLTKTSDNIAKINSAIDVVGDGVFNNVLVNVPGHFKGEVEQVPSSANVSVTKHILRTGVELDYTNATKGKVKLTGANAGGGIIEDLRLPKSARPSPGVNTFDTKGLNRMEHGGISIPPIIKDTTPANSEEWIKSFLFGEEGLALSRLDGNLEGKLITHDSRVKFLEWVLGNVDTPEWNSYKTDRIVALRQIDVDALTGLDKNNKTISAILDPNRAYLYQVAHVNTVNFEKLITNFGTNGTGITDVAEQKRFTYELASHLNQTIGNRVLIIPNNDNSQIIDTDGKSIFILN